MSNEASKVKLTAYVGYENDLQMLSENVGWKV